MTDYVPTYTQQAHDCSEHLDCTVIVCVSDELGTVVWESHDGADVDPAGRVNPDVPAEDHTGDAEGEPIEPAPPDPEPGDYPDWAQPQGAHDAYPLGARVAHQAHYWQSTLDANTWEPGVYGWEQLPDSR